MILALDTSGAELLVALLDLDGGLVDGRCESGRRHQERVMELIQELLEPLGGAPALSSVAVARGPGSQTGLRVGLATAEGLAFARRLPLVPLSSLDVAAHRPARDGEVIAAVSAGRRNLYAQRYGAGGLTTGPRVHCSVERLREELGGGVLLPVSAEPALAALLEAAGQGPLAAARPGVEALAGAVAAARKRGVSVAYDGLAGDYGD